ncbi:metallophosphoesterase [Candidatus Woesearchaeota archaeon]|nr:metallophosphoesterase [Candidatus Woesearchaeota archaeon]
MEIIENIEAIGLTLYLKKQQALILSDIHLGYEEALYKKGVIVPRFMLKDIILRLESVFEKVKPEKIIITGDLKHEFGEINQQEWREIIRFLDFLLKHCKELIIIKGNHDKFLLPITKKRKIILQSCVFLDNYFILHGDEIPDIPQQTKAIIIGHEHCAIALRQKNRVERYKCFVSGEIKIKNESGKNKRYNLIAMPSLNTITEGTDILNEQLLSPFLQENLSNFSVFAVGGKNYDEMLEFGKVKVLRKMVGRMSR